MAWGQKMMPVSLEKRNDTVFKDIKVGCKEEGCKLLSVSIAGGRRNHSKEE